MPFHLAQLPLSVDQSKVILHANGTSVELHMTVST